MLLSWKSLTFVRSLDDMYLLL